MIRIAADIFIDEEDLHWSFVRSGGPGGQNVNKVSTAVQLRFNAASRALPEDVRRRLIALAGKRATDQGEIVIIARTERSQERNRQEALQRLAELIEKALVRPKRRIKTRPSATAREKRLSSKHIRAKTKTMRHGGADDE
ncbi:MAG TPA: alternative ribosome rescue aminoacyl-tRNA hydrolase ArfB [Deltaproteobacteria bacterium]|nr:alternative ribosome rescue aminoacyl-tRNA hydrolase ArfB [Deltaproteobacteria bacterium]HQI81659.1 alternative ribosome rescue aminoacyl-tRNA hydrolase ArfB [Deltaproteobacteria bacterium]